MAPACVGATTGLSYGEGGNCVLNGSGSPGNVNLTGLPFTIDPSVTWVKTGADTYGSATISANRKSATFNGGGDCGDIQPSGTNGTLLLKQD